MLKKLSDKKKSCQPGIDDEKLLFYQSAIYAYEVLLVSSKTITNFMNGAYAHAR